MNKKLISIGGNCIALMELDSLLKNEDILIPSPLNWTFSRIGIFSFLNVLNKRMYRSICDYCNKDILNYDENGAITDRIFFNKNMEQYQSQTKERADILCVDFMHVDVKNTPEKVKERFEVLNNLICDNNVYFLYSLNWPDCFLDETDIKYFIDKLKFYNISPDRFVLISSHNSKSDNGTWSSWQNYSNNKFNQYFKNMYTVDFDVSNYKVLYEQYLLSLISESAN